jgi:hypothetical protein
MQYYDVLMVLLFTNQSRINEPSLILSWSFDWFYCIHIIFKISFVLQYGDVLMVSLFTYQSKINELSLVVALEF